jgi:hypothetical protein
MFRRRKKKNKTVNETQPESPPSTQTPDSDIQPPVVIGIREETKTPPLLSDAFKSAVEKAADRSRNELVSKGKIKPMVFFVQEDGTMKTVSLSVTSEYQKEALIRRIQEKALAENIFTVIVSTEMDGKGKAFLTGVSPGVKGSACIDYNFDGKTRTVDLWRIRWMDQPVPNVFLDGIYGKTG